MKTFAVMLLLVFVSFSACKSTDKKTKGPKGEYIVASIKKDTVAGKEIQLIFDEEKGRVSGKAVCNSYSATYVVSGNNIKFSPAVSTKMMCPEGTSIEYNFFQALLNAKTFSLKSNKLSLLDAEEQPILIAK
ncbi:MAG: META domain-containing protein [Bacteroidota bacterium]|nr:META domain-containing protein [Bacteroidota bacterium]MEE3148073.1 META domain-containing protein [Bacteroidota bacterium]